MKPGHPVCERCPHRANMRRKAPLGLTCPEGPEPVVTMEIPLIGQISRKVKPTGEDFECTRSTRTSGVRTIKWAWDVARGRTSATDWMKVRKDGAVEVLNEGKRRRVYPDGTVLALINRRWENIGKIQLKHE